MNQRRVKIMVRLLKHARRLLRKRNGWTRFASARNSDGIPVSSMSPNACSFCSSGAVSRAARDIKTRADAIIIDSLYELDDLARVESWGFGVIGFNDPPVSH